MADEQPGSWWQATGLLDGVQQIIRWDDRGWTGPPGVLDAFLIFMMLDGWGDGKTREMYCPPGIMGFGVAAEAAAKAALGEPLVIDYEFQDAPEGAIGSPA
jgi:hypothetical protein